MDVEVLADEGELARRGADLAIESLSARRDPLLLAATGTSPMGLYRELAERRTRGEVDFSRLRVAQLDEYLDVGEDDPRSLYGWLVRAVARPLGVSDDRLIRLDAGESAAEDTFHAYERAIERDGGVDLAILGLGPNGHLGFNEPGSTPDAPTRVVDLAAESLDSNARYWEGLPVPRRAATAGMNVILAARRVLLVVLGEHKRAILRRILSEPIGPLVPASFLRAHHAATVLADRAAYPAR